MKQNLKLIYRIILVAIGIYGLYLNFSAGKDIISELLLYFTILSNLLVVLFFAFLLINNKKHKTYSMAKGAITMSITVTLIVFHFILRPTFFNMTNIDYDVNSSANIIVHYILPIMTILDWIIFDKKGKYKKIDPCLWLMIPFIYFIFVMVNGILGYTFSTGSHYPYFFLDIDKLGIYKVGKYVLIIIIAFLILGYIYYAIDFLLGKMFDKKRRDY